MTECNCPQCRGDAPDEPRREAAQEDGRQEPIEQSRAIHPERTGLCRYCAADCRGCPVGLKEARTA